MEENKNIIPSGLEYENFSDAEIEARIKESLNQSQEEAKILNAELRSEYSLFPCVRVKDDMNFYCLYSLDANKWFVFDKIIMMIVDYTDTDSFRFEFSTPDNGPEETVRYLCNDNEDMWNREDTQEITSQLKERIKGFDEAKWRERMNLDSDDVSKDDMTGAETEKKSAEDIQNYRYENFVLNKFKKKYLGSIIKIESGGQVRFVKVIDFNVDYKKNSFARLLVSGQTVSIESGDRYFRCKFSDWKVSEKMNVVHFIGYLDELMLLMKNKKNYMKFEVLSNEEVDGLFDEVKSRILANFDKFMKELEETKELFREEEIPYSIQQQ